MVEIASVCGHQNALKGLMGRRLLEMLRCIRPFESVGREVRRCGMWGVWRQACCSSRLRLDTRWRVSDWERRRNRMIETWLLGLVTVLLLVYLVYALLRPEKF
jgi:K+-transporting ATPase KdpF subunit